MKEIGKYAPTEYPYIRIEGGVREAFIGRVEELKEPAPGEIRLIAADLSELGPSEEHQVYVDAVVQGFLGHGQAYRATGATAAKDKDRHHQNGYVNGENARRELVS